MKDAGFRFAWAFEGSWDKELKNDPRFVKTYARAAGKRDGKSFVKLLDYHICTEEDLAQFPPLTEDSERTL